MNNIIKAAEAGYCGDPFDYRDFSIAPPMRRPPHLAGDTASRERIHVSVDRLGYEPTSPLDTREPFTP